jgi:hypothetical protein
MSQSEDLRIKENPEEGLILVKKNVEIVGSDIINLC